MPGMQKSTHKAELEICVYSPESCRDAFAGGADRVELCASPPEGGVTPSYGAICLAREYFPRQLFVMIRPRGGDFCYSDAEFRTMEADIRMAKQAGADGVVLGILCTDGTVDVERTRKLTALASPLQVTFHRAFDMTSDPFAALEEVIVSGCHRILTSGQKATAPLGALLIGQLVVQAAGRIELMAGSGVLPENALLLLDTGVQALHSSARRMVQSQMLFRREQLSMGPQASEREYDVWGCDSRTVRQLKELTGL